MSGVKYNGPKVTNLDTFILKARWVHGDVYDYSGVEYRGTYVKVNIGCRIHGSFLQSPNNHLNKFGCPNCGRQGTIEKQKFSQDVFIKKAREVHGDTYDYSLVNYTRSIDKIKITCRVHGEFVQQAASHLQGVGCFQCSYIPRAKGRVLSTQEFISRSRSVHGDKYDYSRVVYKGAKHQVEIGCPAHGFFKQDASGHSSGNGCMVCSKENSKFIPDYYHTNNPASLYVFILYGEGEKFVKVGVSKDVGKRAAGIRYHSGYEVENIFTLDGPATEVLKLEQEVVWSSMWESYKPTRQFPGATECFHIKECDALVKWLETHDVKLT